ncbi:MAG: hypothetical protein KY391_06685 [Actinobacteria bacterium]|nr:hypothetical protein [Actinomycetota bacterium]
MEVRAGDSFEVHVVRRLGPILGLVTGGEVRVDVYRRPDRVVLILVVDPVTAARRGRRHPEEDGGEKGHDSGPHIH